MFLTSQSFLFMALSILALLAIYFWRRYAARRIMPALFLWDKEEPPQKAGSKWMFRRIPGIFYLEAAILLCLTLAAAGPFFLGKDKLPPIAVILDNSFSMLAIQENGKSARDCIIQDVMEKSKSPAGRQIFWILAGSSPRRIMEGAPADFWKCQESAADIPAAIALARYISPDGDILVATDHKPQFQLQEDIAWISKAAPQPNAAIVNIKSEENKLLAEIENFSTNPVSLSIALNGTKTSTLELASKERQKIVMDLIGDHVSKITITSPNDALKTDDMAFVPSHAIPPISYRILPDLPEKSIQLLNRTLSRNPVYISVGQRELCIGTPDMPAGEYHRILWHSANTNTPVTGDSIQTSNNDTFSDLMRGLTWQDFVWQAHINAKMPGEALAWQNSCKLISIAKRGEFYDIHLNLNETAGNLATSPFWPALFWNISAFLKTMRPGPLRSIIQPGEILQVRSSPPNAPVHVTMEDGTIASFSPVNGMASIPDLPPGLHKLEVNSNKWMVAVNSISADESNLDYASSFIQTPKKQNTAILSKTHPKKVDFLLILAAIAMLSIHQFVICNTRKHQHKA